MSSAVTVQRRHCRVPDGGPGGDHARVAIQYEMQVPAEQPRFIVARVEQWLRVATLINAMGSLCLGKVAAGATEGEVAHLRVSAV